MVSVCLPSDALLQHLSSYLCFSYLGHGVSLHSCSSKAQPLLLTLDEGYLFTAAPAKCSRSSLPCTRGISSQPPLLTLNMEWLLSALLHPHSHCSWEQYCTGTWNAGSMNQGKLEVVKQEMARVNVNILGISKLKWTGMGEFNSVDH